MFACKNKGRERGEKKGEGREEKRGEKKRGEKRGEEGKTKRRENALRFFQRNRFSRKKKEISFLPPFFSCFSRKMKNYAFVEDLKELILKK